MTPILIPGDVLLYRGGGIFSVLIMLKTWHSISHVEIYIGDGLSLAARDGKGVGKYSVRTSGLRYVLRPELPFQKAAALDWFYREANGRPYSWLDLINFIGIPVNARGLVCSPFAAKCLREGAVPVFNREHINKIAPFQFLTSELLEQVWPEIEDVIGVGA